MEDYDHTDLDGDWEKPDNTESGCCAESTHSGNMWTLEKRDSEALMKVNRARR